MQGVGPGSLLGGRYLIGHRVSVNPRFERWTASDQALDREVVVLCFPTDSPAASAAVDSARRAAGIEEVRLVRVLDVGVSDGVSFVVEEPLTGARSLTTLVATGGLPSEEARRLVGEAASALESARIRGLHHGALGPRSVLVLHDGAIKVRGLATEAALLGIDETESRTALRTDAVALAAIIYAALTGRWPLPASVTGVDPGLAAAPTVGSGVAAPAEVAPGVPADLDTLARLTLNHDQGPQSPGDLAAQIAPWSPTAYAVALARPSPPPAVRPAGATTTAATHSDTAVPGAAAPATARRGFQKRTVLGMAVAGAVPGVAAPPAAGPSATPAVLPLSGAGPTSGAGRGPDSFEGGESTRHAPAVPGGDRDGEGDDWVWGAETDQTDKADEFDESGAAGGRPASHDTGSMRIIHDVRLSDTLEAGDDEPPVPLGSGGGALARDQSKIALLVVAILVVAAAVIGFSNLTGGGSAPPRAALPTTATTPAPTPSSPPTTVPTTTPSAPPSSDIAITNAQAWDPQGDGQEGNASAPRAYDGNPATVWQSQSYTSPGFGGYAKSGFGLVLDLGQETEVHRVITTLRGGADFTVYLANRLSLDGATSIGSSSGQDGEVTINASGAGAKGTLVILWFTKLAPDGAGMFSAQVAEVKVS